MISKVSSWKCGDFFGKFSKSSLHHIPWYFGFLKQNGEFLPPKKSLPKN
jgi:hypothetical protein